MSQATKRKHVFSEILQEQFTLPTSTQQIVRVKESKGNNLHEVEAPDSSVFLVSMPTKFRKNVWIKKGDYILIEPIEEGDKVKGEMVKPLLPDYVKYLKCEKHWPPEFEDREKNETDDEDEDVSFTNPNRRVCQDSTSDESD